MKEFKFKTKPLDYQKELFDSTKDKLSWALFLDTGVGKTKISIDTIAYLYCKGEIDVVLVVAPNGVQYNWTHVEIPKHMSDSVGDYKFLVYNSTKASTKKFNKEFEELLKYEGLSIFAMHYQAFPTKLGPEFAKRFLKSGKSFMVLDEAHRIKTPKIPTTKAIISLGKWAKYKRILSGTPITNRPFDCWSQIQFLDAGYFKKVLNTASYFSFERLFGIYQKKQIYVTGGILRVIDDLVSYKNLDLLKKALKGISNRVLRSQVLNLIPKEYTSLGYELEPIQKKLLAQLEKEYMVSVEGELVTAELPIVRLLRTQQILCGYLPTDDGLVPKDLIPLKKNPRLNVLLEKLSGLRVEEKSIIWNIYTKDVDMIMEALSDNKIPGRIPVRYDGKMTSEQRLESLERFENEATDIIINIGMCEGLTLTQATETIFYTNSFNYMQRFQAEARNDRIGQENQVTVTDIICVDSERDLKVIEALKAKEEIIETVLDG